MKKLILTFALAIGMITSVSAQKEGDQSFGFSVGYNTNTTTQKYTEGNNAMKNVSPKEKSFGISVEYGKFISNNIRVGVGVSYNSSSQADTQDGSNSLIIAPSLTYYKPIADKLYFTPHISAGYASLTQNYENGDYIYTEELSGYTVEVSLLSFEYRYSEKLAINLNVGSFQYASLSYDLEDNSAIKFEAKSLNILSNASIGFNLYF